MPPHAQWENLERRVNRMLESVVQLRNANAQIMKDNVLLKKQLKDLTENSDGSAEELEKLRAQYDEAMQDLKQVKANLQRIESLANELKLENY
jgi:methyl-accepting chemotaxis protein